MTEASNTQFQPELALVKAIDRKIVGTLAWKLGTEFEDWQSRSPLPAAAIYTPSALENMATKAQKRVELLKRIPIDERVYEDNFSSQTSHRQFALGDATEDLKPIVEYLEALDTRYSSYTHTQAWPRARDLPQDMAETLDFTIKMQRPGAGRDLLMKAREAVLATDGSQTRFGSPKSFANKSIRPAIAEVAAAGRAQLDGWTAEIGELATTRASIDKSFRTIQMVRGAEYDAKTYGELASDVRKIWGDALFEESVSPAANKKFGIDVADAELTEPDKLDAYVEQIATAARGDLDITLESLDIRTATNSDVGFSI